MKFGNIPVSSIKNQCSVNFLDSLGGFVFNNAVVHVKRRLGFERYKGR